MLEHFRVKNNRNIARAPSVLVPPCFMPLPHLVWSISLRLPTKVVEEAEFDQTWIAASVLQTC